MRTNNIIGCGCNGAKPSVSFNGGRMGQVYDTNILPGTNPGKPLFTVDVYIPYQEIGKLAVGVAGGLIIFELVKGFFKSKK